MKIEIKKIKVENYSIISEISVDGKYECDVVEYTNNIQLTPTIYKIDIEYNEDKKRVIPAIKTLENEIAGYFYDHGDSLYLECCIVNHQGITVLQSTCLMILQKKISKAILNDEEVILFKY